MRTAKPAKMAKSCMACRASKVRCQVEDEAEACTRCARLALQCIFVESRRGQPNAKRDQARLGPAARALLRATGGGNGAEAKVVLEKEIERTRAADHEAFCWNGHECQRKMVQSISSADGKLALLKHWLLIGVRSGSCGLLGNVLLLAHSCGIPLDEINVTIARPLPTVEPVQLPPFIQEWLSDERRLSCVRSQVQGEVSWQPSTTFVSEVGDEATLRTQMQAADPGLANDVDSLVCTAEMFLATPLHPEDRMALARLNGLLWSTMVPADVPQAASASACVSEATAPVLVRCRFGSRASAGEAEYAQCTLSGRTVVYADSRAVHSIFSLVPQEPAAAPPLPLPVGLPEWLVDEMTAEMIEAAEAQLNSAHGYGVLEDLGLELEPEDLNLMIATSTEGVLADEYAH